MASNIDLTTPNEAEPPANDISTQSKGADLSDTDTASVDIKNHPQLPPPSSSVNDNKSDQMFTFSANIPTVSSALPPPALPAPPLYRRPSDIPHDDDNNDESRNIAKNQSSKDNSNPHNAAFRNVPSTSFQTVNLDGDDDDNFIIYQDEENDNGVIDLPTSNGSKQPFTSTPASNSAQPSDSHTLPIERKVFHRKQSHPTARRLIDSDEEEDVGIMRDELVHPKNENNEFEDTDAVVSVPKHELPEYLNHDEDNYDSSEDGDYPSPDEGDYEVKAFKRHHKEPESTKVNVADNDENNDIRDDKMRESEKDNGENNDENIYENNDKNNDKRNTIKDNDNQSTDQEDLSNLAKATNDSILPQPSVLASNGSKRQGAPTHLEERIRSIKRRRTDYHLPEDDNDEIEEGIGLVEQGISSNNCVEIPRHENWINEVTNWPEEKWRRVLCCQTLRCFTNVDIDILKDKIREVSSLGKSHRRNSLKSLVRFDGTFHLNGVTICPNFLIKVFRFSRHLQNSVRVDQQFNEDNTLYEFEDDRQSIASRFPRRKRSSSVKSNLNEEINENLDKKNDNSNNNTDVIHNNVNKVINNEVSSSSKKSKKRHSRSSKSRRHLSYKGMVDTTNRHNGRKYGPDDDDDDDFEEDQSKGIKSQYSSIMVNSSSDDDVENEDNDVEDEAGGNRNKRINVSEHKSMRGRIRNRMQQDMNEGVSKGRDAIVSFLKRLGENAADKIPNSNILRIPFVQKTELYKFFCEEFNAIYTTPPPSHSYFCSIWKADCPHIKLRTPDRVVNDFGKCDQMSKVAKDGSPAKDKKGSAIWPPSKTYEAFISGERIEYKKRKEVVSLNPNEALLLMIDGSDQFCVGLPQFTKHSKLTRGDSLVIQLLSCMEYRKDGCHLGIFALSQELSQENTNGNQSSNSGNTSNSNIGTDGLGGDNLVEAIHRFLTSRRKHYGGNLPRTLYIQIDLCSMNNKNWILLTYIESLVMIGVFDEVQVSFMSDGHGIADMEDILSPLRFHLLSKDIVTFKDMIKEIERFGHKGKPNGLKSLSVVHMDNVANFSGLCRQSKCLSDNIINKGDLNTFRHFRFMADYNLIDDKDIKRDVLLSFKRYSDDKWKCYSTSTHHHNCKLNVIERDSGGQGLLRFLPNLSSTPARKIMPNSANKAYIVKRILSESERIGNKAKIQELFLFCDQVNRGRIDNFSWCKQDASIEFNIPVSVLGAVSLTSTNDANNNESTNNKVSAGSPTVTVVPVADIAPSICIDYAFVGASSSTHNQSRKLVGKARLSTSNEINHPSSLKKPPKLKEDAKDKEEDKDEDEIIAVKTGPSNKEGKRSPSSKIHYDENDKGHNVKDELEQSDDDADDNEEDDDAAEDDGDDELEVVEGDDDDSGPSEIRRKYRSKENLLHIPPRSFFDADDGFKCKKNCVVIVKPEEGEDEDKPFWVAKVRTVRADGILKIQWYEVETDDDVVSGRYRGCYYSPKRKRKKPWMDSIPDASVLISFDKFIADGTIPENIQKNLVHLVELKKEKDAARRQK